MSTLSQPITIHVTITVLHLGCINRIGNKIMSTQIATSANEKDTIEDRQFKVQKQQDDLQLQKLVFTHWDDK